MIQRFVASRHANILSRYPVSSDTVCMYMCLNSSRSSMKTLRLSSSVPVSPTPW